MSELHPGCRRWEIPCIRAAHMELVDRYMVGELGVELIQMVELAGYQLARLARTRFLSGDPRGRRWAGGRPPIAGVVRRCHDRARGAGACIRGNRGPSASHLAASGRNSAGTRRTPGRGGAGSEHRRSGRISTRRAAARLHGDLDQLGESLSRAGAEPGPAVRTLRYVGRCLGAVRSCNRDGDPCAIQDRTVEKRCTRGDRGASSRRHRRSRCRVRGSWGGTGTDLREGRTPAHRPIDNR